MLTLCYCNFNIGVCGNTKDICVLRTLWFLKLKEFIQDDCDDSSPLCDNNIHSIFERIGFIGLETLDTNIRQSSLLHKVSNEQ
jgi:hypothetical protein